VSVAKSSHVAHSARSIRLPGRHEAIEGWEKNLGEAQRTGSVLMAQVLSLAFRSTSLLIVGRYMGAASVGLVVSVVALGSFVALVAGTGLRGSAIYFLPQYAQSDDGAHRMGFIKSGLRRISIVGFSITIISAFVSAVLAHYNVAYSAVFVLASLFGTWSAAAVFLGEVLKADNLPLSAAIFFQGTQAAILLPLVAIAVWLTDSWQVVGGCFAIAAASTTGLLFLAVRPSVARHADYSEQSAWSKYSLPLVLSGASLLVLSQAPVLVVGALASTEQAGIYAVCYRIAAIPVLCAAAINSALAPAVVLSLRAGEFLAAGRRYRRIIRINLVLVAGTLVGVVALGKFVLSLHGAEFTDETKTLIILTLGLSGSATVGPVAILLTAVGRNWDVVISYGLVAVATLAATAFASSTHGALGAATVIAIAMATQATAQSILLRRAWPSSLGDIDRGAMGRVQAVIDR